MEQSTKERETRDDNDDDDDDDDDDERFIECLFSLLSLEKKRMVARQYPMSGSSSKW